MARAAGQRIVIRRDAVLLVELSGCRLGGCGVGCVFTAGHGCVFEILATRKRNQAGWRRAFIADYAAFRVRSSESLVAVHSFFSADLYCHLPEDQ